MRLMFGVCDIQPPITRYVRVVRVAATFVNFLVLSLGYAHAQLRSLYSLSTFKAVRVRKNTSSPLLHNFGVRVPECGSLGMRLQV